MFIQIFLHTQVNKKKGITLQTSLEELVSIEYWILAESYGWLQPREKSTIIIDQTILLIDAADINKSILLNKGFSANEALIVLSKVKDDKKVDLSNLIYSLALDDREKALIAFKFLLNDIIDKLRLTI